MNKRKINSFYVTGLSDRSIFYLNRTKVLDKKYHNVVQKATILADYLE
jgi:hypothetical protein